MDLFCQLFVLFLFVCIQKSIDNNMLHFVTTIQEFGNKSNRSLRRKPVHRLRIMMMSISILFSIILLPLKPSVNAFHTVPSHFHFDQSLNFLASNSKNTGNRAYHHQHQRSSRLDAMTNLQDIMFHAQSTASSLASISLDDPSNVFSSIPVMYGAGLLTAFSPCVWGLLPLTVSYISTAAGEREDSSTTLPTLSFAAGLASVFCTLGLVAASVGGAVYGNSGNTNIVLPLLSNGICCLMGFQLLELINLPLPTLNSPSIPKVGSKDQNDKEIILMDGGGRIISSYNDASSKNGENGSLFRTFLLGGSSALVASPCATPVLASILAFVANSSNPLLGGFLLLFYTFGYSTPLLVTAATGGQALIRLKELGGKDETSIYAKIAPWVTPFTASILLWYGTSGLLTALLGDPSLAGMLTSTS